MAKKKTIRFMYYVDGKLDVAEAKDSYEYIRDTVRGMIEHVPLNSLDKNCIDMWCNDEGKLIGLEPSIVLSHKGKPYDCVVGNVVFSRHNRGGDTVSLTDDDIKLIRDKFEEDGMALVHLGTTLRYLQVLEF